MNSTIMFRLCECSVVETHNRKILFAVVNQLEKLRRPGSHLARSTRQIPEEITDRHYILTNRKPMHLHPICKNVFTPELEQSKYSPQIDSILQPFVNHHNDEKSSDTNNNICRNTENITKEALHCSRV